MTESGRGNPKNFRRASRAGDSTPLSKFLDPPLGGIYVEDQDTAMVTPCFYQLLVLRIPPTDLLITLGNNTADEAGSALYGGGIAMCYLYNNSASQQFLPVYNSGIRIYIFFSIFKIIGNNSRMAFLKASYTKLMCILGKPSKFQ